jgi:hypothetical protein
VEGGERERRGGTVPLLGGREDACQSSLQCLQPWLASATARSDPTTLQVRVVGCVKVKVDVEM